MAARRPCPGRRLVGPAWGPPRAAPATVEADLRSVRPAWGLQAVVRPVVRPQLGARCRWFAVLGSLLNNRLAAASKAWSERTKASYSLASHRPLACLGGDGKGFLDYPAGSAWISPIGGRFAMAGIPVGASVSADGLRSEPGDQEGCSAVSWGAAHSPCGLGRSGAAPAPRGSPAGSGAE